jgi:hypothetical protein
MRGTYASCRRVIQSSNYRACATNTNVYTASEVTTEAAYGSRDGARAHWFPAISKYVLLGGWYNPPNAWSADAYDNNEVWTSPELTTWTRILDNDPTSPTSGAGARWRPRHTFCSWVHQNKLWVAGSDQYDLPLAPIRSDVWNSEDAETWTRVAASSPWGADQGVWNAIPGYHGGLMHVIGGNRGSNPSDWLNWSSTAQHWVSEDGVDWERLSDMPFVRSMCMDAVTLCEKMFIIGGNEGTANTRDTQSDTWAWNGSSWHQISADSRSRWQGRDFIGTAAYDDKLWVFTGTNNAGEYLSGCYYSRDLGFSWELGPKPLWSGSHADAWTVGPAGIVCISGNHQDQTVSKVVAS